MSYCTFPRKFAKIHSIEGFPLDIFTLWKGTGMDKKAVIESALKYKDLVAHPFAEMMDMDGYEAVFALCLAYGGTSIYIPKCRGIFGQCMEREIQAQYNGVNIKQLARQKSLSGIF